MGTGQAAIWSRTHSKDVCVHAGTQNPTHLGVIPQKSLYVSPDEDRDVNVRCLLPASRGNGVYLGVSYRGSSSVKCGGWVACNTTQQMGPQIDVLAAADTALRGTVPNKRRKINVGHSPEPLT